MRIGYLTSEYPGVSHTFIQREVAEMRRRELAIETFSVRRPGDLLTELDRQEAASTFYLLPFAPGRYLAANLGALVTHPLAYLRMLRRVAVLRTHGLRGWAKWLGYFAEAIVLAGELRRRGIGHLHNQFANASANVAMLAGEFLGIPWSFTFHGVAELEWEGVGRLRDKVHSARFVVCICDFNRSQAMRMSDVADWPKITVSRCGLDLDQFPPAPPKPDGAGPIQILSVARLSMEKGIPGLLEAFQRMVQAGIDAQLRVVGDGPERPVVQREIERLGLSGRCTLLGKLGGQDVVREFQRADIFAMASLMEGLPIVLMEAMVVGVPVVAPGLAGIPELVVNEESGIVYAPARWDQLADAMIRLSREPALRQRLADVGRAQVRRLHDIRTSVEPMARLLTPTPSVDASR